MKSHQLVRGAGVNTSVMLFIARVPYVPCHIKPFNSIYRQSPVLLIKSTLSVVIYNLMIVLYVKR